MKYSEISWNILKYREIWWNIVNIMGTSCECKGEHRVSSMGILLLIGPWPPARSDIWITNWRVWSVIQMNWINETTTLGILWRVQSHIILLNCPSSMSVSQFSSMASNPNCPMISKRFLQMVKKPEVLAQQLWFVRKPCHVDHVTKKKWLASYGMLRKSVT